jgi:AraC family carnitine catabolism transcriptional activator
MASDDNTTAASDILRVGILLLPQYSNLGLALLIEPMAIANWLSKRPLFEWTLLSTDGAPVRATNGMETATRPLNAEAGAFSTVFVVASFEAKHHAKQRELRTWLQRESCFGTQIVGIETGTELLAAAALLSGQRAAVHWDNLEGFQEAYPAVKATRQLFTLTPRLATCAGGTAIVDLMHHWISQQTGEDLAIEISQHLLHARPRGTHEAQLMPSELDEAPMNSQIRKVIRLMHDSVAAPLSCEELADAVGLSKRQLERKFKQYTATSPVRYYVNLRLSMAHKLLQQTELSVSQVAAATGFDSFEHFSRIYKAKFGCPPSGDRLQSWDAPVMRQPVSMLESEPDYR